LSDFQLYPKQHECNSIADADKYATKQDKFVIRALDVLLLSATWPCVCHQPVCLASLPFAPLQMLQ